MERGRGRCRWWSSRGRRMVREEEEEERRRSGNIRRCYWQSRRRREVERSKVYSSCWLPYVSVESLPLSPLSKHY